MKIKLSLINIIVILSFFLAAVLLAMGRVLPIWIEWLLLIFITFMTIISVIYRSWILKIILIIVLVLGSATILYYNNAASRIVKLIPTESTVLSLYATKESKITKIDEAKGKIFGYSANLDEATIRFIRTELDKNLIEYALDVSVDDITNLLKLEDNVIDVLVINDAMHQNLLELETTKVEELVLIGSMEMVIPKENIAKPVDVAHQPFIIFISGNDIAGPISVRSRSDVDIIMVVNPITKKILTVSIPRDTYTPLGCRTNGLDKLTNSGIYGIDCTVKTIEMLVNIDVNYYVRLNFTSLINIVDVIGDIDVYSKYDFTAAGNHFNVGMNTLDANQTLLFSRERKSFPTGDIQRGLNQQEVIKAIIKKITTPRSILKVEGIINAISGSIDTNLLVDDFSKLIRLQLETNAKWDIKSSNLSGSGDMLKTYSMGERLLYVMHPSQNSLKTVQKNIMDYLAIPN